MVAGPNPRQVANQLMRMFRAEADLLRVLGGWTARVTENDERLALSRDIGFRAEHAELLRCRLHRLRTTDRMFHVPGEPWRDLIHLVDQAPSAADLVAAVYSVIGTQLAAAYRRLIADCDPLADELTVRMVERNILPDHVAMGAWGVGFLTTHRADPGYVLEVAAAVEKAGGLIDRSGDVPEDRSDDGSALGTGFWPLPRTPPERIHLGSEYRAVGPGEKASYCPTYEEFGPPEVEILVNHHGLMPEIASLCIVGSLLYEVDDRPWEFYRDFAVQCSDEVRHIGLLVRRLGELGSGTDAHPFPGWTFYDAVGYLPAAERTLVFNAIVEGNVVETLHDRAAALEAAGNPDSAYVSDWISADESLHLHNGMRWLSEMPAHEGEGIDELLSRGQALLGQVMKQKDATVKVFDSESETLAQGDFYAPRRNPIAPIARELGGFSKDQIEKLVAAADGRTIRR